MPTEIIMPKMGMSMTEGRVARWLKQPGEAVSAGEELVEIETEKIVSIVEAPASGTLAQVLVPEGESALVQAVLALITAPGEALPSAANGDAAPPAAAAAASDEPALKRPEWLSASPTTAGATAPQATNGNGKVLAAPAARRVARELGVDLDTVAGTGPRSMIVEADVRRAAANPEAKTQAARGDGTPLSSPESLPTATGPALAAPAARRVARELGVDLAGIVGSGPRGMIVEADVRKAAEAKAAAPAPSAPAATGTPSKGGLRRVSFYSDGQKLAGVLYLPSGATGPVPGVVLLVGYTYLKEMVVAEMARSLARDGFAALIFDYRGFGESEGPKERLFPLEQVADAHAAVTFLGAQPEVDSAQIAAVGLSLGGSHAVAAAATDQRIRAAVAIESPADGERWLRSLRRYSEWLDFAQQVADDRVARTVSGQGRSIDSLEIMVPDPGSASFLAQVAQEFPQLRTQLSLASADALIAYSPEAMAQGLGERPLLVIHGDADRLVPVAEAERLWGNAPNSRLEIIKGMGHFDWVFPMHPTFKHIMATISAWLREAL